MKKVENRWVMKKKGQCGDSDVREDKMRETAMCECGGEWGWVSGRGST